MVGKERRGKAVDGGEDSRKLTLPHPLERGASCEGGKLDPGRPVTVGKIVTSCTTDEVRETSF
jgi:hypothetical protein